MSETLTTQFAGHEFILHWDRALYWPAFSTLLVADVHLGKGAVFRRQGLALPTGDTSNDLTRLEKLIDRFRPQRLIVLGDLLHDSHTSALTPTLEQKVTDWRQRYRQMSWLLINGNHDRYLARIPTQWMLTSSQELEMGGIVLRHEHSQEVVPEMAGHIHPVIVMQGGNRDRLRAPVFWQQTNRFTLPAFGAFTGGFNIKRRQCDKIFVVGPEEIILW